MNAFSSNIPEYWTFHYFIASQSYENYLALFPFPQKVLGHRSSARLTFAAELREWDRRRLSMALPFFAMMYNLLHERRSSSWRELPLGHGRCWFRSTCPPPCCCCWCTGWRHSAARARGHRGRLWQWEPGHGRMLRWEQKAGGSIYCCQAHAPTHAIFVKKNNANNKRQSLRGRGWMLQWKVEVVDIKPLFQPGTYSHPQGFPLHPTYLQNKHLKSRRYLCHW